MLESERQVTDKVFPEACGVKTTNRHTHRLYTLTLRMQAGSSLVPKAFNWE